MEEAAHLEIGMRKLVRVAETVTGGKKAEC
jgi:hypothetical protein